MRALIAIAALLLLLALSAGLGMAFMAGVLRLWPGLLQNARVAQVPAAAPAMQAQTATALPSPTATVTATPTATPIFQMPGRVTGDQLRLRRTPGSAGERIGRLPADTALALQGRSADFTWYEVTTADGLHGWVGAEYIELVGQTTDLPVTGIVKTAGDEASVARNAQPAPALLSAPDSRDKPVVEFLLLPDTPLGLAGRSSDGLWLQVVSPYGDIGWVPADKVNLLVPLDAVAITFEIAAAATNRNRSCQLAVNCQPGCGQRSRCNADGHATGCGKCNTRTHIARPSKCNTCAHIARTSKCNCCAHHASSKHRNCHTRTSHTHGQPACKCNAASLHPAAHPAGAQNARRTL